MKKNAVSGGPEISEPEQREKPIDDWYEDWRVVGRGIEYSNEQDTIRCLFCKRHLILFPKTDFYSTKYRPWHKADLGYDMIWDAKMLIRRAQKEPLCNNEGCDVLWVISGSL